MAVKFVALTYNTAGVDYMEYVRNATTVARQRSGLGTKIASYGALEEARNSDDGVNAEGKSEEEWDDDCA